MRASCQPIEAASSDLPIPPFPPPIDQIWRRVVAGPVRWQDFGHAQGHFKLSTIEVSNLRAALDFLKSGLGAYVTTHTDSLSLTSVRLRCRHRRSPSTGASYSTTKAESSAWWPATSPPMKSYS